MKKFSFFIPVLISLLVAFSCSNKYKNLDTDYNDADYEDSFPTDYYGEDFYGESSFGVEDTKANTIRYKDYQATRTVYTDLINTKLELKPDWEKSYLYGRASITAKPHFYPSDSLILDAKGMTINSVKLGEKLLTYVYKDEVLKITLDKTYTRDESYTVVIDYIAKPNERVATEGNAITSDKGLYFINPNYEQNNYMPQIWTQGETESNSVWFPTIDSPNFKSAQEVYLTVDKKYKTLSNGKLISSKENGDGTRTDYWKQEQTHSVYLFMVAIGEFEVVEDFYTKKDGTKILVDYYVEPEWKDQAKAIFGKTPKMIQYFSDLLGVDYPWDKYSQIVVREYVSGAMENTGAVVFGDFVYKTDRELADNTDESVIAHELFHHWFGDLVTAESWSNLPLNESFANYSQYLWDEHEYGKDVAQYNMEEVVKGYYNSGTHHNLIWFDYKHRDDIFDAHSYNKGGAILHQLRAYLGDDAFFTGLNHYLKRHAYKSAEYNDLRIAFEDVCGEDLNWYFNQWFLGVRHPEVKIKYHYNYGKTEVYLTLDQETHWQTFVIPMVVKYIDDAGEHIKKFKITEASQVVSLDIRGELKTIIIDPDKTLLGSYEFKSTADFWLNQFDASTNYLSKKEAIIGFLNTATDKVAIKDFVTKALNDPFYGTQITVLNELGFRAYDDEFSKYVDVSTVQNLAKSGTQYEVRKAALGLLMGSDMTLDKKIQILEDISTKEQSYSVLATVLEYYIDLAPEQADTKIEEFSQKHASADINFTVALYYIQNRVANKIDFFKNMYEKASLREKWEALIYYGYYSFSSSLPDMKNYVSVVDEAYPNAGRYKTHIIGIMVDVTQELLEQEKSLEENIKNTKENKQEKQIILEEIKDVRMTYEAFLEKYDIKIDDYEFDY